MDGITVEMIPTDHAGTVVLKPIGSIDSSTTHVLESQIKSAMDQQNNRIVIDFSGTDFISSAGLGIFLGTVSLLRNRGGDLLFMKVPDHIAEVFDIINLQSYFVTVESIDDIATVEQRQ